MTEKEKQEQAAASMKAGMELFNKRKFSEAMAEFSKALQLDPANYEALFYIGKVFYATGNPFGQELAAKQLMKHHPDRVGGYRNLVESYLKMGRIKECLDILKKAVKKFPQDPVLVPNLLFVSNCAVLPASEAFELHRKYAANYEPKKHILARPPFPKTQKIKIGLVSTDFYAHSVNYFLSSLFLFYDDERFEFHLFSNTERENYDDVTKKYKEFSASWHDIRDLSDREAADLVKKEQISVLIDLNGYTTAPVRMGIFGLRPAPVQITWLGYPSTTGMRSIDFRITDNFADPQDADRHHSEKLLRLNTPFLCYTPTVIAAAINHKIPETAEDKPIVFGSFNNTTKYTDESLSLWSSVLKRVPGSVLSLKSSAFNDPKMCNYYLERFAGMGIEKERIETKGFSPSIMDHLIEYYRIDIALDSIPYNGTTTTCEAMYMGVPTIALMGNRHVACVSAALNLQAGFPEFVAKDEAEFLEIAAHWAGRKKELCEYKNAMRTKMLASPLCNAKEFTKEWERVVSSLVEAPC